MRYNYLIDSLLHVYVDVERDIGSTEIFSGDFRLPYEILFRK